MNPQPLIPWRIAPDPPLGNAGEPSALGSLCKLNHVDGWFLDGVHWNHSAHPRILLKHHSWLTSVLTDSNIVVWLV